MINPSRRFYINKPEVLRSKSNNPGGTLRLNPCLRFLLFFAFVSSLFRLFSIQKGKRSSNSSSNNNINIQAPERCVLSCVRATASNGGREMNTNQYGCRTTQLSSTYVLPRAATFQVALLSFALTLPCSPLLIAFTLPQ